ncbi:MAG TPA: multidrug efflux SMR transporter [Bacillota bacterium]|nr:multidrug efflux SMR transporter [Bacillota bacterium]
MAWVVLVIAGLFETYAVAMINQFSVRRHWQTLILIVFGLGMALGLLSYSLQTIPMGTGYAIWTGISVVGSSLVGILYFNEEKSWQRILLITIILCSALGLKLVT